METKSNEFFLPYLSTRLEIKPPNKAPRRDRLAIQEPSSDVTRMWWDSMDSMVPLITSLSICKEARAGEE